MKPIAFVAGIACLLTGPGFAAGAAQFPQESFKTETAAMSAPDHGVLFSAESATSEGSVTAGGQRIEYRAVAGTLVVHPKGWDDATAKEAETKDAKAGDGKVLDDEANPKAESAMFYVAYFKKGAPAAERPITFLYNGGPGSSTVWLHMGAFGPRRVVTKDNTHTPAAPYQLIDNASSLLDVSDLVFIDAPGTGFSRIAGKDKEKGFYGVDEDAFAFGEFITGFLSKFGRWNSPKYLFGESYGTPRSAVLVNALETGRDIDFNGVVLLSQILNFDLSDDVPQANPGTDESYIVALPTYAASAWYHNRLPAPRPADLQSFLHEVERFATTDYALALQAGSSLDPVARETIAKKISDVTGLPQAYILKSDLRIDAGQFQKTLRDAEGLTAGRLDTRFTGPSMDPLSKEVDYDPQSAAIGSAYVSGFNDYVRRTLGFGQGKTFKPEIDVEKSWNYLHQPPGAPAPVPSILNVMPDLASAMKYNPDLKVMVNGGYFDLATPYYEGWYEMHHLPIAPALQSNIEYHYYQSGHMVYANEPSLKALHDNVADFIRRTDNLGR